ncbi:hypothetical protein [Reyranella sp.]
MKSWVAAVVVLMLLPLQALAWGPEGHSIIAELAQRRISPRGWSQKSRAC